MRHYSKEYNPPCVSIMIQIIFLTEFGPIIFAYYFIEIFIIDVQDTGFLLFATAVS